MKLRDLTSALERREFVEKETGVSLKSLGNFGFDEKAVSLRNCENLIGAVQVPSGVAGPLKLKSQTSKLNNYYIPLATTEGALVASVSRGCKAISDSGGANVLVHSIGTTRGPVFKIREIREIREVGAWLNKNFEKLQRKAALTSSHLVLTNYDLTSASPYLFIRFYFNTQDAMGMNMATIATDSIIRIIESETRVKCISIAGNYDNDKKPSWLNNINGRGIKAWADIEIPSSLVTSVLKTTPEKFYETWLAKCMIGSALSGSMGFNSHFANIIAALFIATGQDPAHVVEGSLGITTVELRKSSSLYVSIHLPSLMLGTVGGGTAIETQKEALQLLGVYGGNQGKNKLRFAGIVAAVVLAGEISLVASLAEGSLARTHQRLGRGIQK